MPKILISLATLLFSFSALSLDREAISKLLAGDGLTVEIHGQVPDDNLFVMTYRNPEDFFDFTHMSALFEDTFLQAEFSKFTRMDKVLLWGKVIETPSPQIHVKIEKFLENPLLILLGNPQ